MQGARTLFIASAPAGCASSNNCTTAAVALQEAAWCSGSLPTCTHRVAAWVRRARILQVRHLSEQHSGVTRRWPHVIEVGGQRAMVAWRYRTRVGVGGAWCAARRAYNVYSLRCGGVGRQKQLYHLDRRVLRSGNVQRQPPALRGVAIGRERGAAGRESDEGGSGAAAPRHTAGGRAGWWVGWWAGGRAGGALTGVAALTASG